MPIVVAGALLVAGCASDPGASNVPALGLSADEPATQIKTSGGEATWELSPGQTLDENTRSFSIEVTRKDCSSGVTEPLLPPIIMYQESKVIIFAQVEPNNGGTCPSNNAVTQKITLSEPLDSRILEDGQTMIDHARPDAHRWAPGGLDGVQVPPEGQSDAATTSGG